MSPAELREKVATSANIDWYSQVRINFAFPYVKPDLSLVGIPTIYDFVCRELDVYEKASLLPTEMKSDMELFLVVKKALQDLVISDSTISHEWNVISSLGSQSNKIILPSTPEGQFLISLNQEHPEFYAGALRYLSGSPFNLNTRDKFNGYILAFQFYMNHGSGMPEWDTHHREVLSTIVSQFQKKFTDVEEHATSYISRTANLFETHSSQIDSLKIEKEQLFDDWFAKAKDAHETFSQDATSKILDFENLYHEKLKLEAPANYWNIRAKSLRMQGLQWLICLLVCVALIAGILIWLLNALPTGGFDKIFGNSGLGIKWSIALVTLISFFAFAIRIFSKLTFSAFHLSRDAEEREQLTYVYLALQREKGIDQTERHLIMQSLFSRADSGLLKEESSPTMPGNIVDQVVRK